jgi:hypothetical protein
MFRESWKAKNENVETGVVRWKAPFNVERDGVDQRAAVECARVRRAHVIIERRFPPYDPSLKMHLYRKAVCVATN